MDLQTALFKYCLRLGDTCLVLGHRLSELCGQGPLLEEDIALTNIALDYIGQAEAFLKYAAEMEGKGRTEDDLAYRRPEREYYNLQLVEQPNTDFAYVIIRQFFIDAFHFYYYRQLAESKDEILAGIAAKSLKEVKYHLKHSKNWVIRLGKGTEESHGRIQNAIDDLWMYTGELFETDEVDDILQESGIGVNLAEVQGQWQEAIQAIFEKALLQVPEGKYMATGSRQGIHTENLGFILAEMQYLQRAYPDANW